VGKSNTDPARSKRQLEEARTRFYRRAKANPLRRSIVDHLLEGELWPDDLVDIINDRSRYRSGDYDRLGVTELDYE
jgi:hypothetical protein